MYSSKIDSNVYGDVVKVLEITAESKKEIDNILANSEEVIEGKVAFLPGTNASRQLFEKLVEQKDDITLEKSYKRADTVIIDYHHLNRTLSMFQPNAEGTHFRVDPKDCNVKYAINLMDRFEEIKDKKIISINRMYQNINANVVGDIIYLKRLMSMSRSEDPQIIKLFKNQLSDLDIDKHLPEILYILAEVHTNSENTTKKYELFCKSLTEITAVERFFISGTDVEVCNNFMTFVQHYENEGIFKDRDLSLVTELVNSELGRLASTVRISLSIDSKQPDTQNTEAWTV